MRPLRALLAGLLLTMATAMPALAGEAEDAAYLAMVEAARTDPGSVDFAELRRLYRVSRYYKRYESDPTNLLSSRPPADEIDAFVTENYALLSTHFISVQLRGHPPESVEFEQHAAAVQGILAAIAATGDGKSAATAYEVLVVSEEYNFIGMIGGRATGQRLVEENSRVYDVMTAERGSQTLELWFDVTSLFRE